MKNKAQSALYWVPPELRKPAKSRKKHVFSALFHKKKHKLSKFNIILQIIPKLWKAGFHSTTGTKTRILEKHIDTKNVKNQLAYEMKQSS